MSSSEYATDAEVLEAVAQGRKEAEDKAKKALAAKASAEIMSKVQGEPGFDPDAGPPPLKPGEWHMPDPPSDAILMALGKAIAPLQAKLASANTHDRDAIDQEIRERCLEQGIVVDIKWWFSSVPGCYIPEVEPYAVTDMHARSLPGHKDYDPDQQVHQVVHDEIGTGTKGVIGGRSSSGLYLPGR